MSQDISPAEIQLCLAAKNIRKPSFSNAELRDFGEMVFRDDLRDWNEPLQSFCKQGFLQTEEDRYRLTPEGEKYVERAVTNEFFGKMLVRAEQSQAFGRFCERVYGRNLTQFGTADMEQLETLLSLLNLNENSLVLDVGCGIGATTEYISDRTGAMVTGFDLAKPVIKRAQARTLDKADRLTFLLIDINDIDLPPASFDTIISIDTLYFAKDLPKTIGQLKAALKPGGQMGLFFSETDTAVTGVREHLTADRTKLARALTANGFNFTTEDLTRSNLAFWERSQQIVAELKPEFEVEGNGDLCHGRLVEGESVLNLAKAGRMTRYLYHVQLPA
jgi:2-polyprenyl-3-methyl-5-hydroxy-6-metoxy-1,4-benzoquinol methylase